MDEINGKFEADHGGTVLTLCDDNCIVTTPWQVWSTENKPMSVYDLEEKLRELAHNILQTLREAPEADFERE